MYPAACRIALRPSGPWRSIYFFVLRRRRTVRAFSRRDVPRPLLDRLLIEAAGVAGELAVSGTCGMQRLRRGSGAGTPSPIELYPMILDGPDAACHFRGARSRSSSGRIASLHGGAPVPAVRGRTGRSGDLGSDRGRGTNVASRASAGTRTDGSMSGTSPGIRSRFCGLPARRFFLTMNSRVRWASIPAKRSSMGSRWDSRPELPPAEERNLLRVPKQAELSRGRRRVAGPQRVVEEDGCAAPVEFDLGPVRPARRCHGSPGEQLLPRPSRAPEHVQPAAGDPEDVRRLPTVVRRTSPPPPPGARPPLLPRPVVGNSCFEGEGQAGSSGKSCGSSAGLERLELSAFGFEARRSIQLSYSPFERNDYSGFDPALPGRKVLSSVRVPTKPDPPGRGEPARRWSRGEFRVCAAGLGRPSSPCRAAASVGSWCSRVADRWGAGRGRRRGRCAPGRGGCDAAGSTESRTVRVFSAPFRRC